MRRWRGGDRVFVRMGGTELDPRRDVAAGARAARTVRVARGRGGDGGLRRRMEALRRPDAT